MGIEVMEHIIEAWQTLPEGTRESGEGTKLKEVVTVFAAWFGSYLDLLS